MSNKDKVVALPKPKPEPTPDKDRPADVLPFERPKRRCEIEGCGRDHEAKGRCRTHYLQWRREHTIVGQRPTCTVEGCEQLHAARGYCMTHYRLWRKANTVNADLDCTKCGLNKRWAGHSWCRECRYEAARELFVRRYRSDPAYFSARRIKNLETNFRLKQAVVAGYGADRVGCSCCGERGISFLTVDHINGGGNADRRATPGGWTGIYRRLIREGFPPDCDVKCMNCNWSKRTLGRCAHEGGEISYLPPAA